MSFLCSKRRSMYSMKSACQYLAIHPTTYYVFMVKILISQMGSPPSCCLSC